MVSADSSPSSLREIVVLPAPEGEESTSIRPRRLTSMKPDVAAGAVIVPMSPFTGSPSLDVLDLLAQLLDGGLQVDADGGEADIGALGAEGVGFGVELLAEEVELASDRAALGDEIARRRDMRRQPVQFFPDVGLARQDCGFLCQPVL